MKTYSADVTSQQEEITVDVPSGANEVKVYFKYHNANNDWYWSVDDVRVGEAG